MDTREYGESVHSTTSALGRGSCYQGGEFTHEGSSSRRNLLKCNVLHRVLYPQVHENGFKKK